MIIKKYFTKMICKRDVIHINGGLLVKKLSGSVMFICYLNINYLNVRWNTSLARLAVKRATRAVHERRRGRSIPLNLFLAVFTATFCFSDKKHS